MNKEYYIPWLGVIKTESVFKPIYRHDVRIGEKPEDAIHRALISASAYSNLIRKGV